MRYKFATMRNIFYISIIGMVIITILLFSEYLYFRSQSENLRILQEDYRTYIMAVNKILRDYNKTKEKLEEINTSRPDGRDISSRPSDRETSPVLQNREHSDQEKKKIFSLSFPSNVIVFSSDDCTQCYDNFLIVNRDSEYLKNESLQFIQMQENDLSISQHIDIQDWGDYTEYALSKIMQENEAREKQRRSVKKRLHKIKKKPKVSSYVKFNLVKTTNKDKKTKKDIFLSWPIEQQKFWISSLYGPRKKKNGAWGFHYGVDMAAWKGTPVCAAYTGIVIEARYSKGYGNNIVLAHSPKYRTRYAHLSKIAVKVGQKVKRGEHIGAVGDTGYVRSSGGKDASHLHFELLAFGKKVNPMPFISFN